LPACTDGVSGVTVMELSVAFTQPVKVRINKIAHANIVLVKEQVIRNPRKTMLT
jgi:hypothetical protein